MDDPAEQQGAHGDVDHGLSFTAPTGEDDAKPGFGTP